MIQAVQRLIKPPIGIDILFRKYLHLANILARLVERLNQAGQFLPVADGLDARR